MFTQRLHLVCLKSFVWSGFVHWSWISLVIGLDDHRADSASLITRSIDQECNDHWSENAWSMIIDQECMIIDQKRIIIDHWSGTHDHWSLIMNAWSLIIDQERTIIDHWSGTHDDWSLIRNAWSLIIECMIIWNEWSRIEWTRDQLIVDQERLIN